MSKRLSGFFEIARIYDVFRLRQRFFQGSFLVHETGKRLDSFQINLAGSRPNLCFRISFPGLGNIFFVEFRYAGKHLNRFFSVVVQPLVGGHKRL